MLFCHRMLHDSIDSFLFPACQSLALPQWLFDGVNALPAGWRECKRKLRSYVKSKGRSTEWKMEKDVMKAGEERE